MFLVILKLEKMMGGGVKIQFIDRVQEVIFGSNY